MAMQPFAPRTIRFQEILAVDAWRLKLYSISFDGAQLDWPAFAGGLDHAYLSLPHPAADQGRPGLGFVIAHRGRTAKYVVLGWWDQENELPLRVFVQPVAEAEWRPARGGESICVWDLEVIWFEREAYVGTVLSGQPDRTAEYLNRHL